MNDKTRNRTNPSAAKVRLLRTDPCVYLWKLANMMMFWLANTTRTPKKKPTLNDVGNLFRTNVPKTPNAKCISPVQTAAMIKATDPSFDCCILTTVVVCWLAFRESKSKIRKKTTFFCRRKVTQSWTFVAMHMLSGLWCWYSLFHLLSKIANTKYRTTNSRLIPHALWTDPLGSGLHDANIALRTRFFSPTAAVDDVTSTPGSPPLPSRSMIDFWSGNCWNVVVFESCALVTSAVSFVLFWVQTQRRPCNKSCCHCEKSRPCFIVVRVANDSCCFCQLYYYNSSIPWRRSKWMSY